jgi:rhodanese-related sulfurtransferase
VTFLPGVMHVQKTMAQTVGNKDYGVLLDKLLRHTVPEVTAQQVVKMDNIILLDTRKKAEFDVSHLKSAIWVGYSDFDDSKMIGIDKQQQIIVYCSVGFRSEKIAEKLLSHGYKNVSNLYGGIFEWVNAGYEVVNTFGKTTNVHTFNKNWGKWSQKGNKVYR